MEKKSYKEEVVRSLVRLMEASSLVDFRCCKGSLEFLRMGYAESNRSIIQLDFDRGAFVLFLNFQ